MMETELDPKETWKATRSRILSSILLMLVFLALVAGLLLVLGWIVNQAGEGTQTGRLYIVPSNGYGDQGANTHTRQLGRASASAVAEAAQLQVPLSRIL